MRLLIVTQAVDRAHPVLGFFHEWIAELSQQFEQIEVICLCAGDYALPKNVRVYSLGKERGSQNGTFGNIGRRVRYTLRFFSLAWQLRTRYDAAFVHMNQEYVLLAGPLWKVLGKRIYLWRNHYAGSLLTDIAAAFCTKVFCTSRFSYTAKYKRTMFMPVGVDTKRFYTDSGTERRERSILFLARMSPSKNPRMLLEALRLLRERNESFTATFAGSALPEHQSYYQNLTEEAKQYGLMDSIRFVPVVTHDEAPGLYRAHGIFVNCSRSGMFDKTLFESAACGCVVLAASHDFAEIAGKEFSFNSAPELAEHLSEWLNKGSEREAAAEQLHGMVDENSLSALGTRIAIELQ